MPIEKLRHEHGAAQYVLNRLEVVVRDLQDGQTSPDQLVELRALLGFMERFDRCHCSKSEEALFPVLQRRHVDLDCVGQCLPKACNDHARLRGELGVLRQHLPGISQEGAAREQFTKMALNYIVAMREHMHEADRELMLLERDVLTEADDLAVYDAMLEFEEKNRFLSSGEALLPKLPPQ
jgi:hemerythrin-like domain-containing protein